MDIPDRDRTKINERIISIVHKTDTRFQKRREKEQKKAMGRERLLTSPFSLNYKSERKGKKSYCISSSISLRVHIIQTVKALISKGKEVLEKWRAGDHALRYPIGIYPPSMPRMGNLIPGVVL